MDLSSKIAICLSGQVRTGVANSAAVLAYIGEVLPQCDFFIHTWDVNSSSPAQVVAEDEKQKIRNTFTTVDPADIKQIADTYKPLDMRVDNFKIYQETHYRKVIMRNGQVAAQIPMFQSIWEVNQLKKSYEALNNSKYGTVVRLRLDISFPAYLIDELNYISGQRDMLYFVDPDNKYPKAIEDICWIATSEQMDTACNFALIRETIDSEIDWQLHMKQYLDGNNIRYRPFKNNTINIIR
jgi:hypothetical protein